MTTIKLITKDEVIFEVDKELFICSNVLKDLMQFCNDDEDDSIPLSIISSITMNHIIEWVTHYKDDPLIFETDEDKVEGIKVLPEWDSNFFGSIISIDQESIFYIIEASYYLDIKKLIDHVSKFVANTIDEKNEEQLRAFFNLEDSGDEQSEKEEQIDKSKRKTRKRARRDENNEDDINGKTRAKRKKTVKV